MAKNQNSVGVASKPKMPPRRGFWQGGRRLLQIGRSYGAGASIFRSASRQPCRPGPLTGRFLIRALRTFACRRTNRAGKVSPVVWLVISVLLLSRGAASPAPTPASPEYQLKAVFLFNFAQFVEWPPTAFPEAKAPLVIGVLGDDPFGPYLDETVRGEKVNNRPLVVQRFRQVEEIKTCHVLFISRSERERLGQILAGLKGRNILAVS